MNKTISILLLLLLYGCKEQSHKSDTAELGLDSRYKNVDSALFKKRVYGVGDKSGVFRLHDMDNDYYCSYHRRNNHFLNTTCYTKQGGYVADFHLVEGAYFGDNIEALKAAADSNKFVYVEYRRDIKKVLLLINLIDDTVSKGFAVDTSIPMAYCWPTADSVIYGVISIPHRSSELEEFVPMYIKRKGSVVDTLHEIVGNKVVEKFDNKEVRVSYYFERVDSIKTIKIIH